MHVSVLLTVASMVQSLCLSSLQQEQLYFGLNLRPQELQVEQSEYY